MKLGARRLFSVLFKKNFHNELFQKFDDEISLKYRNSIASFNDFLGENKKHPSRFFYLWGQRFLYLLDNDPNVAVRKNGIIFRKRIHCILEKVAKSAMCCSLSIEDRRFIDNSDNEIIHEAVNLKKDKRYIFVANHGFRDDIPAAVATTGRPVYIFTGSVPVFFNLLLGFSMHFIGVLIINRKKRASKQAGIKKAERALELGTDLLFFPEGIPNKDMSALMLPLWKGIYYISKSGKYEVVPVVSYNPNIDDFTKNNVIHSVIDKPIPLYEMEEQEALVYLRDVMAGWEYKLMEKFGVSTREKELEGFSSSDDKWENKLINSLSYLLDYRSEKPTGWYDKAIELAGDYRSRDIIRPEDAFRSIANMNISNVTAENVSMYLYAKKVVEERTKSDFQRRY